MGMLDSEQEKREDGEKKKKKSKRLGAPAKGAPMCELTLCERLPVVEATHELLAVEGCTLLRSGLGRAPSAHLHHRESARQTGQGDARRPALSSDQPRYGAQPWPLEEPGGRCG